MKFLTGFLGNDYAIAEAHGWSRVEVALQELPDLVLCGVMMPLKGYWE